MSLVNYTSAEGAAMDRDARNMKAAGVPLSGVLDELQTLVTTGNLGITSNAWDVDSLSLGGGAFSLNADTTTGLTFGYYGGRICVLNATSTVAGGTLTLSPSTTNYVQCSPAGVVSSNTSGFTAGYIPLYIAVTGASTISSITNAKAFLTAIPNGGVTGAMLTTASSTKRIEKLIATISSTTTVPIAVAPGQAATLTKAIISAATAVAQSDTNYWSFQVVETGPAGTGTTQMLTSGIPNTTNLTGGSALVANVARQLQLTSTTGNLNMAAYDVILFTATMTGSPTALTNLLIALEFSNAL